MWKTLSKDVRKFGAQCSFLALQFMNKEDQGAKNTSCSQVEDLSINGNQTNFSRSFKSAIKEFSTCSWSAYMGPGWRRPPMCGHAGAPKPGWVGGLAYSSRNIWPILEKSFGLLIYKHLAFGKYFCPLQCTKVTIPTSAMLIQHIKKETQLKWCSG